MADAAGDEPDQDLAGARLGELDLLHGERLAELLEYRGAHLHDRLPAPASTALEAGGLLGAAGRVAGAVGVGAGAGELAAVDDQVLLADRAAVEPALEDLAGAGRVAGLRRQATCPRCAASCRGGASCATGGRCGAGCGNQTSPA